jgi:hypothetical protein
MALTDDLCRSFFDIWHHLDPVAASRVDPSAPRPTLVLHDKETVRQHLAALRSLDAAVEELSPDLLDDEIDQTLLLDAIRAVEHRFAKERPHLSDPAFWTSRLAAGLAAGPGDEATLEAIPTWSATARATLTSPTPFALESGLALLAPAVASLDAEPWRAAGTERLAAARDALETLRNALRDLPPNLAAEANGIGQANVDWRLHYPLSLNACGAGALRTIGREVETLGAKVEALAGALAPERDWRETAADAAEREAASAARPGDQAVVRMLRERSRADSEIRRRYVAAPLARAWGLYAESRAARAAPADEPALLLQAGRYRTTLLAATDLAVHLRQFSPSDAVNRLGERLPLPRATWLAHVRGVLLHPIDVAGAVLVSREWESLGDRWPDGRDAMEEALVGSGLASPTLLGWRYGVGA